MDDKQNSTGTHAVQGTRSVDHQGDQRTARHGTGISDHPMVEYLFRLMGREHRMEPICGDLDSLYDPNHLPVRLLELAHRVGMPGFRDDGDVRPGIDRGDLAGPQQRNGPDCSGGILERH